MAGDEEVGVRFEAWSESGNFALDLDMSSVLLSETRCLMSAPLTPAVSTASGASLAVLASLLDVATSEPALASCRPDWTATQDLTVHMSRPITQGPAVVDARLVRVGKKTITTVGDFYDGRGVSDLDQLRREIDAARALGQAPRPAGHDAHAPSAGPVPAGSGLVTFARIPGASASGMEDYDPRQWVGHVRRRTWDRPPVGTMQARMGLSIEDAASGAAEIALTPYVKNGIGTIFGGAQAALLQFAAEAMRPGFVAVDVQIHYLSQVKVGPARTAGRVLRDASDHSVVSLELRDTGHDHQLLALATVLLQRQG